VAALMLDKRSRHSKVKASRRFILMYLKKK
jgi:hypothetical protein